MLAVLYAKTKLEAIIILQFVNPGSGGNNERFFNEP